jgi:RNA polymerase sigma-70 factor (ECF subfamily)
MSQASSQRLEVDDSRQASRDSSSDFERLSLQKDDPDLDRRVAGLVHDHFDFIWRSLRRLGVPVQHTDDAAQKVFWVAAQKMHGLHLERERSFLFAIALRVAADERRSIRRKREVPAPTSFDELRDHAPSPDELVEQRHARALLDGFLEELPLDLRVVFVLFELEDMTMSEVAALLEIPSGTVASRLRRAREMFEQQVARFRARQPERGNS